MTFGNHIAITHAALEAAPMSPALVGLRPSKSQTASCVSNEWWTTNALGRLWRGHARNEPAGPLEMPVIVFVFRHEHRLVDGSTRVNRRARGDISDTHPVIVVSWHGKNDSTVPPAALLE